MNKEDLIITKYTDNKEYVFISYSSNDKDVVFGEYVLPLQKKYGLRVYCDKDFQNNATEGWTYQMIENLSRAKVCVIFISSTYVSSYACLLEVLTAISNDIPIIKVELETPQITKEHEGRSISHDTKEEYKTVLENLKDDSRDGVKKCKRIARYIERGAISKYQVSESFVELLKSISGLILKENNALEAIKNTIKNEDVFETVVQPEQGKVSIDTKKLKEETAATRGINYVLYGEKDTGNHTEIMCKTFKKVLEKYPEYIDKALEELSCLSNNDYTDKNKYENVPGYFKACNIIGVHGRTVCVGTNLVMDAKLKYIARLLSLVGENSDVLHIEGYELPYINQEKDSECKLEEIKENKSGEKYLICGVRKEGNQASMMWDVFEALAKNYPDKIEKLTTFGFVKFAKDVQDANEKTAQPTAFISCKSFIVNGQEYLVAVSYNREQKLKYIEKMISVCEAPSDFFILEEVDNSIDESSKKKKYSVTGDINYVLYGEEKTGNQSDIMIMTFGKVLKKHPEYIDRAIETFTCLSSIDYSDKKNCSTDMPSYFRVCYTFEIEGKTVCIGTAYGMADKLKLMAKLLMMVGEERDVLKMEVLELPIIKQKNTCNSSDEKNGSVNGGEVYYVSGNEKKGNQSDMMWDVFEALAENYPDKIDKLTTLTSVKLTKDVQNANTKTADPVYFRGCKSFDVNGEEYLVGTSYGRADKIKQICKMINLCGAPDDFFAIEGEEIDEKPTIRSKKQYDI